MEIERKFLVKQLPSNLKKYTMRHITQAYLCTEPVVRIRKDNDNYYLTYKGKGDIVHEEYNLPLTQSSFEHLLEKADGTIINKKRYEIPIENNLVVELDIFLDSLEGLILAEVEFESVLDANNFVPPTWLGKDVSTDKNYYNSTLSKKQ